MSAGDRVRLLRGFAIDSLENYEAPFTAEWLRRHEVTLDEVIDVMDDLVARLMFAEADYEGDD